MLFVQTLGPLAVVTWHRGGVHDRCRSASPVAASLGAAISRGPGSIAPSESISPSSFNSKSDQVCQSQPSLLASHLPKSLRCSSKDMTA